MNYFAGNLAYLRNLKHLGQKDIADYLGCTQSAVANYETGKREPALGDAVKIAQLFETSVEEIVCKNLKKGQIFLARNLRYLRKTGGFDQRAIGDLLGIKTPTVSKYESGMVQPSIEGLINLSEFFGITVDDLLKKDLEKEGI